MRKSNNDMDKIVDLFLYIFPKYLDKISEQRNIRTALKKTSFENIVDKTNFKEEKFNENKKGYNSKNKAESLKNDSLIRLNNDKIISKGGNGAMDEIVKDGGITKGKDIDKNIQKDISKEIGKNSDVLDNIGIINNKPCGGYINGIEKILKELRGEKVDISVTESTMFLLNAVTVLDVTDTIARLKTILDTIIILPIDEIVAIKCDLIYGIKFEENCDLEGCKRDKSLENYFSSIIGKKVSLYTKGDGKFKYINNRIITGTGNGIVIIEGTIAISLTKIVLIEEVK